MVFSSLTFLFYFLPIVLIIYYIVPNKVKNLVLFISSLIFYFIGEPKYVILMIVSILSTYIHGILIEKYEKHKKKFLISSIVISLSFLVFFKYTDFIIENAYFADSRRDNDSSMNMDNNASLSSTIDGEFITIDDTDDLPF